MDAAPETSDTQVAPHVGTTKGERKRTRRCRCKRQAAPTSPDTTTEDATSQADVFSPEALAKARFARLFAQSHYPQIWSAHTDSVPSFPGPSRAEPVSGIFGFPTSSTAGHLIHPRSAFSTLSAPTFAPPVDDVEASSPVIKAEPSEVDLSQPIVSEVPRAAVSVESATAVPLKRSRSTAPSPDLWKGFLTRHLPGQPSLQEKEESAGAALADVRASSRQSPLPETLQSNAAIPQPTRRPGSTVEQIVSKRKREHSVEDGQGDVGYSSRKRKKSKASALTTVQTTPHNAPSTPAAPGSKRRENQASIGESESTRGACGNSQFSCSR